MYVVLSLLIIIWFYDDKDLSKWLPELQNFYTAINKDEQFMSHCCEDDNLCIIHPPPHYNSITVDAEICEFIEKKRYEMTPTKLQ